MKDKLKIGLKGFVFGVANIIPGVSGGTIAILLKIYHALFDFQCGFYKVNFKLLNKVLYYGNIFM